MVWWSSLPLDHAIVASGFCLTRSWWTLIRVFVGCHVDAWIATLPATVYVRVSEQVAEDSESLRRWGKMFAGDFGLFKIGPFRWASNTSKYNTFNPRLLTSSCTSCWTLHFPWFYTFFVMFSQSSVTITVTSLTICIKHEQSLIDH